MKTMKYFSGAAMLMMTALLASCVSIEQPEETQAVQDGSGHIVRLVASLTSKSGSATKALSDPENGTLHAEWAVGEEIWVYYENTGSEFVEAKATVTAVNPDGSANISASLENPRSGHVSFGYPFAQYTLDPALQKDLYTDQLGTLADISAYHDICFGSAEMTVDGDAATLSTGIAMSHETCIWKLSFTDGSSDITPSITSLEFDDGMGGLYTLTPASQSILYMALFPIADGDITFTATTADGTYTRFQSGISLDAGMLYTTLNLALSPAASTTTFTYTASEKVTAFDDIANFTGATALVSHNYADGTGTVVYDGTVTAIGESTFYYDMPARNSMTGITIPASVTTIGDGALSGGKKLETVNFAGASQLTTIGERAFRDCKALTVIAIPPSVVTIQDSAFSGCSALASVTFPGTSSLTTIGGGAFGDCSALTSIILPESLTTLGTRKTEPYEYENGACFWFSGLTSFTLPKNVTTIYGGGHLGSCPLTSLTVAAGNATFDSRGGSNAIFETATNKLVIGCHLSTVPAGVETIGQEAFWAEEQPFSLELPESVTTFENRAFHLARGLSEINIPSGITNIDAETFMGCSGVTDVYCAIADPSTLTWDGADWSFNDIAPKSTLFHVSNPAAWSSAFPDANVVFVGGEVNLSQKEADYTAADGDILTGVLNPACRLIIPDGATVVLKDALIEYGGTEGAAITCLGNAGIILAEGTTNTACVPGGTEPMSGYPGILAGGTGTRLTIGGSGALTVIGGYVAAGIGCLNASMTGYGSGYTCGTIQIDGGTLNAYSGYDTELGDGAEVGIGAVCGGPSGDACEGIVINGGTVTAKGYAGGIGGSGGTLVGDITINGGSITASGEEGPGIGICSTGTCGNISITRGTVVAKGGLSCAGIGTGCGIDPEHPSVCGNISITGQYADVTAIGDECGIGTGYAGQCGNITITSGTVVAVSSSTGTIEDNDGTGAGIGAGGAGVCGDILIKGGTITAKGGWGAAGVGSSSGGSSRYASLTVDSVYFPTYNELKSLSATRGSEEASPIGRGESDSASPDPVYTAKVQKDEANSTDNTWIYKVN